MGWVASSTNRDDAIRAPPTIASTIEIDKPTSMCWPVTTMFDQ